MADAPPRDELVGWLNAHPYTEVYTGQGDPYNGPGEGGIMADLGEPRTADDVIYLWDAINRCRLPVAGVMMMMTVMGGRSSGQRRAAQGSAGQGSGRIELVCR